MSVEPAVTERAERPAYIRWFQSGSLLLMVYAWAHLSGHLQVDSRRFPGDEGAQLVEAMRQYEVPLMGATQTAADILNGYGLALFVFTLFLGIQNFVIGRHHVGNPGLIGSMSLLNFLFYAALAMLGLLYFSPAGGVMLALISLCYLAAFLKVPRE